MQSKLTLEALSWLITAVLALLVLLPIYSQIGTGYPYYTPNLIFIITFITFTRYIFLLRHTPFAYNPIIKIFFIFIPIPLFFYSVDALYDFQRFLDEDGVVSILGNLNGTSQYNLSKYIKYQKLFFGTGAILTLVLLPIRMMVSLWRRKNRGTV